MRLIDADKLVEMLKESNYNHANNTREEQLLNRTVQIVQEQPTAYDVDKVVAQLEERKRDILNNFICTEKDKYVKIKALDRINEIDGAIEIVRGEVKQ